MSKCFAVDFTALSPGLVTDLGRYLSGYVWVEEGGKEVRRAPLA